MTHVVQRADARTSAMRPFHFAFFVHDLEATRWFYRDVLGCREGRSTETWVDFDFFGSQISAHVTGPVANTVDAGVVDGVQVPMPHFGALLGWAQFEEVAARIRQAGIAFIVEPRVRYAGQPGEQMTMFLRDPSGNALEFKSFRNEEHVFTA
ncbi:MAG TPA: VOC family protein [Gemmatimonadales bacterium]|nr:VOC family protein [Gemmatimonadales bacterium]